MAQGRSELIIGHNVNITIPGTLGPIVASVFTGGTRLARSTLAFPPQQGDLNVSIGHFIDKSAATTRERGVRMQKVTERTSWSTLRENNSRPSVGNTRSVKREQSRGAVKSQEEAKRSSRLATCLCQTRRLRSRCHIACWPSSTRICSQTYRDSCRCRCCSWPCFLREDGDHCRSMKRSVGTKSRVTAM